MSDRPFPTQDGKREGYCNPAPRANTYIVAALDELLGGSAPRFPTPGPTGPFHRRNEEEMHFAWSKSLVRKSGRTDADHRARRGSIRPG
jgi:hypothetical protein